MSASLSLPRLAARAFLSAAAILFAIPSHSQTVGAPIAAGSTPAAIVVNPATNKIYVANSGSNSVTVVDGKTRATKTIAVSAPVTHLGVNPDTNRIYASVGANVAVIDGSVDAVLTTLLTGGAAMMTVTPYTDRAYVIRPSTADEVNIIQGDTYPNTLATASYQPTALAINPVNNYLYVVHQATGDVVALDVTNNVLHPPRVCPDGSGGIKPFDPNDSNPGPCINVPDVPIAVAVNPVTNRIYAVSSVSTGQVSVIDGTNQTFVSLSPPGVGSVARAVAVNPLTNKVYAAFAASIVVIDGATNAMTVIPSGSGTAGPVAIGINTTTNKIYVPNANGTLTVINGDTNAVSTLAIPVGAAAIAVNPVTNVAYVMGNEVTPVTGSSSDTAHATRIDTAITALPGNSGASSGSITLNVSNTWTPPGLAGTRKVYYQFDGTDGAWKLATGTGPYSASLAGLPVGSHTLYAFATNGLDAPSIVTHPQHNPIVGAIAAYAFTISSAPPAAPAITLSRASIDFGGQSMATTSPPQTLTVTNTGTATLTISAIAVSSQFAQSSNCSSLAVGASCTIDVTFQPAVAAGSLNSTTAVSGTLTITSNASTSPTTATLAGSAEKSLVTHYYRSILQRAPDAAGKSYWQGEAARVAALGANVNEVWYALAMTFFSSGEYAAFNRSNASFVEDLYKTFFNRPADAGGLAYWSGELAAGMPREVILAGFMFSPEFTSFTQAIFGNTAVRPEIDMVLDFYRGLLGRLPDDAGFNYWLGRFRAAQCQGASAVAAEADLISALFLGGAEYAARGRTNAQFVGDLYNAFLRRGGDRAGVQYWIDQLDTGARSRENVRQAIASSAEFSSRVSNVASQSCIR